MRIQTPLILFFVFVFSLALQAQDEKAVRKATDEFMTAMKNWEDLEPYISTAFMETARGKKVNMFMVDKYQITKIDKALATVEIDHGKGKFCTRLVLEFVTDKSDGKVRIKPADLTADSKMIEPWKAREKLCEK
jgi:phage terminase large subunit-like protein